MLIETLDNIKDNLALITNKQKNFETRQVSDKFVYICAPLKHANGNIVRTYIVKAQIVFITNTLDESQGTYEWREVEKINYSDETRILSKNGGNQELIDKMFNNMCICIGKTWNESVCERWPERFVPFEKTQDPNVKIFTTQKEAQQYINKCKSGKQTCNQLNSLFGI